jgi:hypothetical protein
MGAICDRKEQVEDKKLPSQRDKIDEWDTKSDMKTLECGCEDAGSLSISDPR